MGMAIGVALVAASPAPPTHPFTETLHHGSSPDAHVHTDAAEDNSGMYRQGMITVLCIYVSFLFLPVLLYNRRNAGSSGSSR